jgi:AAA15 family ATPase/GTPase
LSFKNPEFILRRQSLLALTFGITMQLLVKNLGPIKECQIDLTKKFLVFVGYNNTGKTYLAHLIWAIFHPQARKEFVKQLTSAFVEQMAGTLDKEWINLLLDKYINFIKSDTLPRVLNIIADIDKYDFLVEQLELKLQCENLDFLKEKKYQGGIVYQTKDQKYRFIELSKDKDSLSLRIDNESEVDGKVKTLVEVYDRQISLISEVIDLLFDNQIPFYLPVTRLVSSAFYQYVLRVEKEKKAEILEDFAKIIKNLSSVSPEIIHKYKGSYTQPTDILMTRFSSLREIGKPRDTKEYGRFIEQLEEILGGHIVIKEETDSRDIYLKINEEQEIPMFLSSSSVNQLSSLYLYLKYWVKTENNFLVIDEPEINLHPSNQVLLVDLLVSFAKRNNNRVLIATHSPLVAEAINNHLHLGFLKEADVDIEDIVRSNKLKINPENALSHKDIGIYAFERHRVINYEVGSYGAFFRGFTDIFNNIRETGEILTDEIYKIKED